jgi:hypothetical protein
MRSIGMMPSAGTATPLTEPLVPPVRPAGPTRRIGANLDTERYVAFKAFVALSGLTGEQVVIIALDRLMSGR